MPSTEHSLCSALAAEECAHFNVHAFNFAKSKKKQTNFAKEKEQNGKGLRFKNEKSESLGV